MNENIESDINDFINTLSKKYDFFKYIYNTKNNVVDSNDKMNVYYSGPYWDNEEIIAIFKTILLGKWLSAGENVHKFEINFSKKFNSKFSLMANSGSSANLLLIGALKKYFNWMDNDEIILSVVGFPTTLSAIMQHNLKPVFIDIEFETLNFDIDLIEEKITSNTKAIFISPVLGNPPNMDRLVEIANKYNIKLVMDNCDSLGSKWRDKYLTEYSVASSCSFYPAHHITTAEGGMVSSDIPEIIEIARSMAWWGRNCYCVGSANLLSCGTCKKRFDKWLPNYENRVDHKYVFTNIGFNLKPLDLQGAVGNAQLLKFDEIHQKRMDNKIIIEKLFNDNFPELYIPKELEHSKTSWFGIPIVCKDIDEKLKIVDHLEKHGIQTRNYFAGNILYHPAYEHLDDFRNYKLANQVLDRVFFMGVAPHYNEKTFNYIDGVLKKFKQ